MLALLSLLFRLGLAVAATAAAPRPIQVGFRLIVTNRRSVSALVGSKETLENGILDFARHNDKQATPCCGIKQQSGAVKRFVLRGEENDEAMAGAPR